MNRIVLVTGAAGGIGRATCECFAEHGWSVVGVDRRPAVSLPPAVEFRSLDVSDPSSVAALLEWLPSKSERLDAIVNNAAIQICKPILEMTVEEWDETLSSNLRSIFLTARYGHRFLKAAGGCIVNVSSVHAVATSRNIAAYAASKGGIQALTRAMALEFAPDGIRVNAVLPGAVDTDMLQAGLRRGKAEGETLAARWESLSKRTPLGRVGAPTEIARVIYFLADAGQSAFVTGASLLADGGATSRLSTE